MIMKDTVKCGLGVERTSLPGGALKRNANCWAMCKIRGRTALLSVGIIRIFHGCEAHRKICPRVTVWDHEALPSDAKQ